jgi:cystathionine beta-synthase
MSGGTFDHTTSASGDRRITFAPGEPQIHDSLITLIGNTPLVRLNRISAGFPTSIVAKVEYFNPGGSVKDRAALSMIEAAERDGLLKPGGTIVEPTSGNTGVGLAIVAAQRGYRCVFVTTDKVAPEKIALLRAYGAEVTVCPVAVAPEDPSSYYSTAERLVREIPGAFRPNQYANPANPQAHYESTGPEIWEQTAGKITHFVAGAGTSGTVTGVARYLKERNPDVKVIVADPDVSVFSGGSGRPYLVEGVGEDFFPAAWQPELYDEVIAISDEEAFLTTRRVAQAEGLLVGGSCGLAIAGALRVAERAKPDDLIVVLLPDSGRGYLSRVFNDDWLADYGFLRTCDLCVQAVIDARGTDTPELVYVNPDQTVRHAIELMHTHEISQIPVIKNSPPFAAAEVMGAVDELALMDLAFGDPGVFDTPVEKVMGPKLPTVGIGQATSLVVERLERFGAVLVLSGGRPHTVLSRSDVLGFLSKAGS